MVLTQEHPKRYIFNHVHHNVGRLALACGIAATYLGLKATGVTSSFTECMLKSSIKSHAACMFLEVGFVGT